MRNDDITYFYKLLFVLKLRNTNENKGNYQR